MAIVDKHSDYFFVVQLLGQQKNHILFVCYLLGQNGCDWHNHIYRAVNAGAVLIQGIHMLTIAVD